MMFLNERLFSQRQSLDNPAIMVDFPLRNAQSIGLNIGVNDVVSDKEDRQERESVAESMAEIEANMDGDNEETDEDTDKEMEAGDLNEGVSRRMDSEDEGDKEMMDVSDDEGGEVREAESQVDGNSNDLMHLIQEAKNRRILRHLTDVSADRAIKQGRALAQATCPLYFAIGRYLQINLPVHGKKLELHNTIVNLACAALSLSEGLC
jgi:hypothetical protein